MHLIVQTYSLIELQQVRSELEQRGIAVHVSDEFTYAIPGMPGAEQPRGLWVASDEDIVPARRIVGDLIGIDRLEPLEEPASTVSNTAPTRQGDTSSGHENAGSPRWLWPAIIALGGAFWLFWVND